jgi:uncharacterized membrane protein
MIAALIILLLGTGTLFIAASTGHAAAELAERGGVVDAVLETHEDLASETQILFAGLSIISLGMYLVPKILRRGENRVFSTFLPLAFLTLYTVGILFLVNTAHAGGRLVHEFGVHALVPSASGDGSRTVQPSEVSAESAENR